MSQALGKVTSEPVRRRLLRQRGARLRQPLTDPAVSVDIASVNLLKLLHQSTQRVLRQ